MKKIVLLSSFQLICYLMLAQTIDTDYSKQKKRIIKMEIFSPLTGNTTLGYEKYIKDWLSWEAKLGIIGLGVEGRDLDPRGIILKGGPKFKLNPDFVTRDLKGSHLLGGKYIRPELVFSAYSREEYDYSFSNGKEIKSRNSFASFAILINYGRQYILSDIISLDYHIGLGYGFTITNGDDDVGYHYSHTGGGRNFPIALSAGLTIGVLLN